MLNVLEHEWLCVYNPNAGGGSLTEKGSQLIQALQKKGLQFKIVHSVSKGHITTLVKNHIEKGGSHILTLGGDGSNNETINGILTQTTRPSKDIVHALLPIGTGNDWAKMHAIPKKLNQWWTQFIKGNTVLHNVGKISYQKNEVPSERYFINIAGLAYDAFLVKRSELFPKFQPAKLYYLKLTLGSLFKYQPQRAMIQFDDQSFDKDVYSMHIGISKFSGGGMQIVPHADPFGDALAVTIIDKIAKSKVILSTPHFYSGTPEKVKGVHLYKTRKISIQSPDPSFSIEADGEFLGTAPATIELIPKAIQMIDFR